MISTKETTLNYLQEILKKLRDKIKAEPGTSFTVISTLLTAYSYLCGYAFEIGMLTAYKIPLDYVSVDVPLILEALAAVLGFSVLMASTIWVILWLPNLLAKRPHRVFFLRIFLLACPFYLFVTLFNDRHSLWYVFDMCVFWLAIILIAFIAGMDEYIFWRSGKSFFSGIQEQKGLDRWTIIILVLFIAVIFIPSLAAGLGDREARNIRVYSVIVNKGHSKNFAIVKRASELTFALSYNDSLFSDTTLIINTAGLDTLKLVEKQLGFKPDTTGSPLEKAMKRRLPSIFSSNPQQKSIIHPPPNRLDTVVKR